MISKMIIRPECRLSTVSTHERAAERPRQNARWKDGWQRLVETGKRLPISLRRQLVPTRHRTAPACWHHAIENLKYLLSIRLRLQPRPKRARCASCWITSRCSIGGLRRPVASALRTEGGLPAMHAMDTSGATSCYFGGVLRCAKGRHLSRVEPYAIPDIRRAASAAFFMNSLNLLAVLMKCGFAFAYVSPSK